jgi:hypothetical protein
MTLEFTRYLRRNSALHQNRCPCSRSAERSPEGRPFPSRDLRLRRASGTALVHLETDVSGPQYACDAPNIVPTPNVGISSSMRSTSPPLRISSKASSRKRRGAALSLSEGGNELLDGGLHAAAQSGRRQRSTKRDVSHGHASLRCEPLTECAIEGAPPVAGVGRSVAGYCATLPRASANIKSRFGLSNIGT